MSVWRDRPTFITGATGLLGPWLVKRLISDRADVVCLVRDWIPECELVQSGLLSKVKIVRGDLRDQALLERTLGEYEIDTVFHLAAQTLVGPPTTRRARRLRPMSAAPGCCSRRAAPTARAA